MRLIRRIVTDVFRMKIVCALLNQEISLMETTSY